MRRFLLLVAFLLISGCGLNNPFKAPAPPTPEQVRLIYPPDSASVKPARVVFAWETVKRREFYRLQISDSPSFDLCVVDTTTAVPNFRYPDLDTAEYFWKVRVKMATYHQWGDWSEPWSFSTTPGAKQPPEDPHDPTPPDGADSVSTNSGLYWWSGDTDGDTVIYTIYMGQDSASLDSLDAIIDPSGEALKETGYLGLPSLISHTTYFWQIRAVDQWHKMAIGPVWSFKTLATPNSPPQPPDINVSSSGYIDELCTFTAQTTDPESDAVRYRFDFGDGSNSGWGQFVASGQQVNVSHSYSRLGTFQAKVKAQDARYEVSQWSDSIQITIKVGPGACWVADYNDNMIVKLGVGGSRILQFGDTEHGSMKTPLTLEVDPQDGCCWVACTYQNSIFKLTPTASIVFDLQGSGEIGGSNPSTPCVDNDGNCWMTVAWDKKIIKYDRYTGAALKIIEDDLGSVIYPIAIDFDIDENWLWVVEQNSLGSGFVSKFDAASGNRLFKLSGFNALHVEIDPVTHCCWVADIRNNLVRKITPDGGTESFGGFFEPSCVSVFPDDHSVWVADKGNDRVVKLSESGVELCSVSNMNQPTSVEVDPADGSCWISDAGNSRVIKVSDSGVVLFEVPDFITPMGLSVNPAPDPD
jgi:DNA-binding beta-propeller fold protein YncE